MKAVSSDRFLPYNLVEQDGISTAETLKSGSALMEETQAAKGTPLASRSRVRASVLPDSLQPYQQVSLSIGFSKQEYWRVLPRPPPRDLPDPAI